MKRWGEPEDMDLEDVCFGMLFIMGVVFTILFLCL